MEVWGKSFSAFFVYCNSWYTSIRVGTTTKTKHYDLLVHIIYFVGLQIVVGFHPLDDHRPTMVKKNDNITENSIEKQGLDVLSRSQDQTRAEIRQGVDDCMAE